LDQLNQLNQLDQQHQQHLFHQLDQLDLLHPFHLDNHDHLFHHHSRLFRLFRLFHLFRLHHRIHPPRHNHPRRPDNANYKVWDPNYILELTKDHDPRIGSCADLGHWTNSGLAAADCIRILKGRVVSSHIKDIQMGGTKVVRAGEGRANLGDALAALKEVGFDGPISIEHEANWEDNVADVTSYVDFVKAQKK
jgi:hypothetical protein